MKSKRIFLSPPHMNGKEFGYIEEAFKSNFIAPVGPQVDAFENEFAEQFGFASAVSLSSGTAAMHLALKRIGVEKDDEIFASSLTFIGSVSPVTFLGGVPVFIDCDRESWNMDPDLLEIELESCATNWKLPKAVVPTDLYGQCCDLLRIVEICERFKVPVICDSAESLGAKYRTSDVGRQNSEVKSQKSEVGRQKSDFNSPISDLRYPTSGTWLHAGVGAKASVFSFNGNKIITTSGGGMLASDDKELIDYARFLSQQARDDAPHYEHSEIGYNYRMSNILAAIGRGQLEHLDQRVERKREIFDYYESALAGTPGIEFMPEAPYNRSNRWLTVILITPEEFGVDREMVRLALEEENIESRPLWKPLHLQPVFDPQITQISADSGRNKKQINTDPGQKKKYPCRVVGGEVSEDLFDRGLCLPSGTAMANSDMDRVIDVILKCHRKLLKIGSQGSKVRKGQIALARSRGIGSQKSDDH
jgi:dTDP-4-amino-4,6-dideoxygalactose transaminase